MKKRIQNWLHRAALRKRMRAVLPFRKSAREVIDFINELRNANYWQKDKTGRYELRQTDPRVNFTYDEVGNPILIIERCMLSRSAREIDIIFKHFCSREGKVEAWRLKFPYTVPKPADEEPVKAPPAAMAAA